jgi:hypothetical protein
MRLSSGRLSNVPLVARSLNARQIWRRNAASSAYVSTAVTIGACSVRRNPDLPALFAESRAISSAEGGSPASAVSSSSKSSNALVSSSTFCEKRDATSESSRSNSLNRNLSASGRRAPLRRNSANVFSRKRARVAARPRASGVSEKATRR